MERLCGWGSKTGEEKRQLNSQYNFMQYVFFEKKVYAVRSEVWGFSIINPSLFRA